MIVIAGGKRGVGATTIAINLAAALADRGERVVLADAARHRTDLAARAGIARVAGSTVGDVIAGKSSAADSLMLGPAGILLLAGRWAPKSPSEFSRHAQHRLLEELNSLGEIADVVVVDVGSGVNAWTRRFWIRASLVIAVTTTDDAAVMSTYAAIKLSSVNGSAAAVRVLANQCDSDGAAVAVEQRLANACQRFLGRSLEALPSLPRHPRDEYSASCREPRVWEAPNSPFGHGVLWLARAVSEVTAVQGTATPLAR
jgi:flagellar biosynthesis protein FlhG